MLKTFLALGDSYTIGEQVLTRDSFPYQTVQLLRKTGMDLTAPEIIAKTGWTTDELNAAIQKTTFLNSYDIVTLLIGVNNQYRGRSIKEFEKEFDVLLQIAKYLAGQKADHVYVLSIPDWGVTPFAAAPQASGEKRDPEKISEQITAYNEVVTAITKRRGCNFIDITAAQRRDANLAEMIAPDGLHPSRAEYEKWAEKLAVLILSAHSAGSGR